MVFSHTIGGMTFTDASFQGNAYADEVAGFPKALEKMVEHVANAYHGVSTDALMVGAGSKALTIANGSGQVPAFALGMPVRIARTSDPSGVWMQGEITAWDGATGIATINVDATRGSGSFSDWSIVIGGHLTTASGTPPLAVSQGGTGASTGKAALANLTPGVAGVIETNANFVDGVIFGPALDPVDWSPRTLAPTSSLMLATVEDGGADAEVNIWDLTDDVSAGVSPLASIVITGAAAPTSIAAAMGYIIVGHEDGITIIDPHDGSWSERTVGWPRSLSTTTTPALGSNNVDDVAALIDPAGHTDARTGGPMPVFYVSSDSTTNAILYSDGTAGNAEVGSHKVAAHAGYYAVSRDTSYQFRIHDPQRLAFQSPSAGAIAFATGSTAGMHLIANEPANAVSAGPAFPGVAFAHGQASGLNLMKIMRYVTSTPSNDMIANINRTFNSGYILGDILGAWLANSRTADRSHKAKTLTENGTVTETAVESGAELKGYSGFTATNNLYRAADTDWSSIGTGPIHISCWFKSSGNSALEYFAFLADVAVTRRFSVFMNNTGTIGMNDICATASSGTVESSKTFDDGKWHKMDIVRVSSSARHVYVDGVPQASNTTDTGSLTISMELGVGVANDESSGPALTNTLSLLHIGLTAPTAAQIRQMYEAERGMFVANAKCLLQSGSADAVLDVSVDPITGKVAITQIDATMIFDGLVVESEPTIASGGTTWEHNLLHGGDRVEINDANLYATVAARDMREDLELLRGLKAGLPAAVDLSKAKAWIKFDGSGTVSIKSSYNIKALVDSSTGQYDVVFGVPFKTADAMVMVGGCDGSTDPFLLPVGGRSSVGFADLRCSGTSSCLTC